MTSAVSFSTCGKERVAREKKKKKKVGE